MCYRCIRCGTDKGLLGVVKNLIDKDEALPPPDKPLSGNTSASESSTPDLPSRNFSITILL